MSHITKVEVSFRDLDCLASAVESIGGQVLGVGEFCLFGGRRVAGYGFKLPDWQYACVVSGDELSFDNFEGRWGDAAVLDKLKGGYSLAVARKVAESQAWYCEQSGDTLLIHHPEGGVLTVTAEGTIDAAGFVGGGCVSASAVVAGALGVRSEVNLKSEFYQLPACVREVSNE